MCRVLRENTPNLDDDTPDLQKRKSVTATNFDSGARNIITRIGPHRIDKQPQKKPPVQPIDNSADPKKEPKTDFRDLITHARDARKHFPPKSLILYSLKTN
jgi:hypothetical protein